jgi:transketolase
LNVQGVLDVAARSGGRIVTVEDNYPGGLDAEIATAIAAGDDELTLVPLTVKNIPKSGREPQEVLDYVGLGIKDIMKAAR